MKQTTTKILSIFIFFLSAQLCSAQPSGYVFEKLGNGINGGAGFAQASRLEATKYVNGNLYITESNKIARTAKIHKWDGTIWTSLPLIQFGPIGGMISDIDEFNNELYVCGFIDALVGLVRPNNKPLGIIKFNGTAWDSLPSYPTFSWPYDSMLSTNQIETFGDKLYYAPSGKFVQVFALDTFGNTTLIYQQETSWANKITRLNKVGNNLLFSGIIDSIVNISKTSGIIYYDGVNFSATRIKTPSIVNGLWVRNDSQYVVLKSNGRLELWENDSALLFLNNDITNPISRISGVTFKDSFLFLSHWGQNSQFFYNFSNNIWTTTTNNHLVQGIAVPAGPNRAIIAGSNILIKGAVELGEGAIVMGRMYFDEDSSCNFSAGDVPLKYLSLTFDNGTNIFYCVTDSLGNYEITVPSGTYTYTPNLQKPGYFLPCTVSTITVVTGNTYTSADLPLHFSAFRDLSVKFNARLGFRARQGFIDNYELKVKNYSALSDSCVVTLNFPSVCSLISSVPSPFSTIGNQLTYKFANLDWSEERKVILEFRSDFASTQVGDSIMFRAEVVNSLGDSFPVDNLDTLIQIVAAAWDPNIKQSSPEGIITANLTNIKYHIHFQNTGNDTAYNVIIVDTFTQKLGLQNLVITATSHPASYSLRVQDNRTLIWEFNNILLPDSNTNESASHGFIAFEANINGNLAIGDSIRNRASIYFDYQKPILTNYAIIVRGVKDNSKGIKSIASINDNIKLYPNPANNTVSINLTNVTSSAVLQVFNTMGQLIEQQNVNPSESFNLNVEHYAKGMYIIKIANTNYQAKLMVE